MEQNLLILCAHLTMMMDVSQGLAPYFVGIRAISVIGMETLFYASHHRQISGRRVNKLQIPPL